MSFRATKQLDDLYITDNDNVFVNWQCLYAPHTREVQHELNTSFNVTIMKSKNS